jgi:peptidoglycan/LPS O-acetylase OafA/YrhL
MPELDSLRGIAILGVVFYHGLSQYDSARLPWLGHVFLVGTKYGWLGVNLFFVLSGFLITGILLDSKSGPSYYKRFYIRRALRILPAYFLLLFFLVLFSRTGLADRHVSWSFVGLSLIYLSNFTNFFHVPMQYGPLWSLAVEEQYYLLWPTAVRAISRKLVAFCALGVFLFCPLLRGIAFALGHSSEVGYTWMVADGLATGSLLAILARTLLSERRSMKWFSIICPTVSIVLIGAGSGYGTLSPITPPTVIGAALRWTLFNILFAGSLSGALVIGTSRWSGIVQRPIMRFFGEISYGLYLVHTLAFDLIDHLSARFSPSLGRLAVQGHITMMLIRFIVGPGFATGCAFLSRRYFEEPFLKLKDRWTASPKMGVVASPGGDQPVVRADGAA